MLCLVDVQAVLALGDLKNTQARRGSKLLYEALTSQYQMVAFSAEDDEIVRMWLRANHMAEWSLIKTWDREWSNVYTEWKVHEVGQFLASGWEIGMVIDASSGFLIPVRQMGVATMQVGYPTVGPGFSDPKRAPRQWAEVSSTVGTSPGGDHGDR